MVLALPGTSLQGCCVKEASRGSGHRARVEQHQGVVQLPVFGPGLLAAAGHVKDQSENFPADGLDRRLAGGDRAGVDCRLPRGVTSASRQGLQVEVDARAYFTEGMTGVDEVDQWLLTVNPHRIARPARLIGTRPYVDVDRRRQ